MAVPEFSVTFPLPHSTPRTIVSMLRFAIAFNLALLTHCAVAQEPGWPGIERLPLPPDLIAPEMPTLEAVPAPIGASEAALAPPVPAESYLFSPPDWDVLNSSYWDPWEGNVELGMSGTEGNAQTFNVREVSADKAYADQNMVAWLFRQHR